MGQVQLTRVEAVTARTDVLPSKDDVSAPALSGESSPIPTSTRPSPPPPLCTQSTKVSSSARTGSSLHPMEGTSSKAGKRWKTSSPPLSASNGFIDIENKFEVLSLDKPVSQSGNRTDAAMHHPPQLNKKGIRQKDKPKIP